MCSIIYHLHQQLEVVIELLRLLPALLIEFIKEFSKEFMRLGHGEVVAGQALYRIAQEGAHH